MKELFKKVNKEKIRLERHKNNLRNYLLESEYFDTKRKEIDLKLIISSVVFSAFLIVVTVVFLVPESGVSERSIAEDVDNSTFKMVGQEAVEPPSLTFESTATKVAEDIDMLSLATEEAVFEESMYEKLIKSDNIKIIGQTTWDNQEVYALELEEDDLIIIYYFNKEKNLLLGTEVLDNK